MAQFDLDQSRKSPQLLSNSDAIRLFRELNVKHHNDQDHIRRTIIQSQAIYDRVDKETIEPETINTLLTLWWQYRNASQIVNIWPDIELFHSNTNNRPQRAHLSYSSVMKSLLFPDRIDIAKCLQCLEWMEQCRYRLAIHDGFLNKLIAQCGTTQNIEGLRYIHKLMDRNLIGHGARTLSNHTALIVAYGHCGRDKQSGEYLPNALDLFHSIPDDSKDAVIIGAMMKVLVDHHKHRRAIQMYHEFESFHNHVIHGTALRSCIQSDDYQMALRIMDNIPQKVQHENVRMATVMMEAHGHFGDVAKAINIFESVQSEYMNAICVGSMMKILIENDIDQSKERVDYSLD